MFKFITRSIRAIKSLLFSSFLKKFPEINLVQEILSIIYIYSLFLFSQQKNGNSTFQGKGDEWSQFVVEKDRFSGGFRLRSVAYADLYLGISPTGHCLPMMGADAQTFALFPEVIQCKCGKIIKNFDNFPCCILC